MVPNCCNSQTLCWSGSNIPNNKLYWHCLSNVTVSSSWTRTSRFLRQAPSPPSVYPHVYLTSCTWLFLQAFPLRCCILQAIKNWRQERPQAKLALGVRMYYIHQTALFLFRRYVWVQDYWETLNISVTPFFFLIPPRLVDVVLEMQKWGAPNTSITSSLSISLLAEVKNQCEH